MSSGFRTGERFLISALKRVVYPALLLVLLYAVGLATVIDQGYVAPRTGRMERLAIDVLYVAVAIAVLRYVVTRRPFFIWLAVLDLGFLLREYHWPFTGALVYTNVVVLGIVAAGKYDWFAEYLDSRRVMTLLAATFVLYLIAISFDQHWWQFLRQPAPIRSMVEETMEVSGHLVLVMLNVFAAREARPHVPAVD